MGASAAVPARSAATEPALTPDTLIRARAIRGQVSARYRLLPGRRLVVTEATSMGVGSWLALLNDDWLDGRIVPTDNAVFFAICSARARCPYPARWAAWRVAAFLPRRQALELALRAFVETTASVVVVSLPTARPVWAVIERDELLASIDAAAVLGRLAASPAVIDPPLRELVGQLTRPRLFAPVALGPDGSITTVRLFGS